MRLTRIYPYIVIEYRIFRLSNKHTFFYAKLDRVISPSL
jgi:hypothetical protein